MIDYEDYEDYEFFRSRADGTARGLDHIFFKFF